MNGRAKASPGEFRPWRGSVPPDGGQHLSAHAGGGVGEEGIGCHVGVGDRRLIWRSGKVSWCLSPSLSDVPASGKIGRQCQTNPVGQLTRVDGNTCGSSRFRCPPDLDRGRMTVPPSLLLHSHSPPDTPRPASFRCTCSPHGHSRGVTRLPPLIAQVMVKQDPGT